MDQLRAIGAVPVFALAVTLSFIAGVTSPERADAAIDLKVSVKWVRTADGAVGPGDLSTQKLDGTLVPCDETISEQDFLDRIEYANRVLALSGRGYRFVTEFETINAPPPPPTMDCGDRGSPGMASDCFSSSSCTQHLPTPIVIAEIMANPNSVRDEDGEWFELFNSTDASIDLENWVVRDNNSSSFTIAGPFVVPSGESVVFGKRGDYYSNGNVVVDYVYPQSFILANTVADAIILEDALGVEIDRVEYEPSWVPTGASMCLKSYTFDNNCEDAWTPSTDTFWSEWTSLGAGCRAQLQVEAEADPVTWKWDPDALNIYMMAYCTGGASGTTRHSFVTASIGQNEAGGFLRPFHELGHSLGICHTHNCFDWSPLPCFCAEGTVGEDCLLDTPHDDSGWNNNDPAENLANRIASENYGLDYDDLADELKQGVLDVLYNIMSYHRDDDWGYPHQQPSLDCRTEDLDPIDLNLPAASLPDLCRHRLSPDQLDRITDFSNTMFRRGRDLGVPGQFANGLTHFVDEGGGSCPTWCEASDSEWECWPGSSLTPHLTIAEALAAANAEREPGAEPILLLRPGSYDESLTIIDRVDLRGTRGTSVIGK